ASLAKPIEHQTDQFALRPWHAVLIDTPTELDPKCIPVIFLRSAWSMKINCSIHAVINREATIALAFPDYCCKSGMSGFEAVNLRLADDKCSLCNKIVSVAEVVIDCKIFILRCLQVSDLMAPLLHHHPGVITHKIDCPDDGTASSRDPFPLIGVNLYYRPMNDAQTRDGCR